MIHRVAGRAAAAAAAAVAAKAVTTHARKGTLVVGTGAKSFNRASSIVRRGWGIK
ncbi:MAG: hypothetical protein WCG15_03825 [Actinomycetes bacterium]|jgi:hypothetical protein